MIDDCARNRADVGCARPEVANVATADEIGEIDEPVEHENPGEEEMPAPPHRQILISRQRRPGRKAALFQLPVVAARRAKEAGRIEWAAEDRRHAGSRIAIVVLARRQRKERMVEIRRRAPGQRRIRIEDLHAAHQQHDKAPCIDPMADTHERRMPENDTATRRFARAQGGRKRRHYKLSLMLGPQYAGPGANSNTAGRGQVFRAAIQLFLFGDLFLAQF